MDFKTIENYFSSEKKCEELLSEYETLFMEVDMIAEKLANGEVENDQDIKEALAKTTGLYMQLNIVTEIANTTKSKEEGRLNFVKVKELEDDNKKVVQAQLDKQISHEVQYLRRLRNIFKAYRDSADKAIGSCQSRLKNYKVGNYQPVETEE